MKKRNISTKKTIAVNKQICNFITEKWLLNFKHKGKVISHNAYAKYCDLSSSTITKIKEEKGYNIPLSTIYKICQKEEISLSDFFIEFDKKYSSKLT